MGYTAGTVMAKVEFFIRSLYVHGFMYETSDFFTL